MKNGLSTFALHASQGEAAAELRPAMATAPQDADGRSDLSALDPETVARRYLQNALASPALPSFTAAEVSGQEGEFKSLGVETVLLTDTQTVKFRQYYRKIPVYGSLVTVELDQANELIAINSALGEPTNVEPVASIAPAKALQVVREAAGYGPTHLDAIPRLYYYFDQQASRWRLVYIIEDVLKQDSADADAGDLPEFADYVVDAHSGELVGELPRTHTVVEESIADTGVDDLGEDRQFVVLMNQAGVKRMEDQSQNVHTHDFEFRDTRFLWFLLPGKYVENPPQPWDQGGVSAHANSEEVVAFLKDVLMRDGLDNRGGKIVSSVNCLRSPHSVGKEWRNAARIPGKMIYGQRLVDGELVSYAAAKDVVAHELLHGLTDHSARLEYRFESGALNESYSDIFGIIVSNLGEPDVDSWNWEMGEDLSETGIPLRDISDPPRHGQPDHMDDFVVLPESVDHGGVHTNSGIHNKAAFNILTAKDDNGDHVLDAVSVAKIFYLALTQHLSRTSGFHDSRQGVLLSAMTLFRNDPDRDQKLAAIVQAFDDVGVQ